MEDEYQPIAKAAPIQHERADVQAMPNAKILARDNHISLEAVAEYTGKKLLKKRDVKDYLDHSNSTGVCTEKEDMSVRVPLTAMRKVIGRRMSESFSEYPGFSSDYRSGYDTEH